MIKEFRSIPFTAIRLSSRKCFSLLALCAAMAIVNPTNASADETAGPGIMSGNYIATVEAETVAISKDEQYHELLTTASKGAAFQVLEDMGDGFLKIKVRDEEGYIPADGYVTVSQTDEETLVALDAASDATEAAEFRQSIVNYGLQFVGGRYSYGGSDPHTGVDCSGFTRYVMQHAAGISLNRSSTGQASQGVSVSADQMRPGDLIFYGNGRSINHVAMYIGNGQIVHASTYKTGIKVSQWNYRTPVKIVNVIGD